jgi:type IV secretory pathway VirB2 component (pilin)
MKEKSSVEIIHETTRDIIDTIKKQVGRMHYVIGYIVGAITAFGAVYLDWNPIVVTALGVLLYFVGKRVAHWLS